MRTLRALRSFFDLNQLTSSQQALVTELEAFLEIQWRYAQEVSRKILPYKDL